MAISMYKSSVPIFIQFLGGLSGVLDKAQAHIDAKKLDASYFMTLRLYPDMHPFVRQVRASTDHAVSASSRISGVEAIKFENTETSIAELKERIAKTIAFLQTIKPEQLDGQEDKDITITFPSGERKFTGQTFLLNFSLPNFYFHTTAAYGILRQAGVEVGKRDFMGTPVQA
ncbi:MAG: hypothetical protein JWO28_1548 [Hyphomicrobiales bacterium]|jgi:hypothetical protein|nr:hypothetical protein [Hyphomicrobiales bacterium]